MPKTLLLTSFQTWMPHQRSNASDDLLLEIGQQNPSPSWHVLRQLPVDFELAPQKAIAHVTQLQPDVVVCCGMAESRSRLSVESRAITESEILHSTLDLQRLTAELNYTEISDDAGRFVCNALYYAMLKHLRSHQPQSHGLFVHVPILTDENRGAIVADFRVILQRLTA
ncbi:peptidase C15 [Oscillatoria sp. FACHB-1407]|uniref:pyroglutamyl-peptidase I family protein n=1 Tax=Oscillatoria sp. FACHB-1407 TaxID=2692847 RepID=UPI001687B2B8|nr:peptidase C15 [Oscillatoria sp. FACHB-1407]MBD2464835.1 peptidase C15 [Oscillatoria sp. FACHB-1407]